MPDQMTGFSGRMRHIRNRPQKKRFEAGFFFFASLPISHSLSIASLRILLSISRYILPISGCILPIFGYIRECPALSAAGRKSGAVKVEERLYFRRSAAGRR